MSELTSSRHRDSSRDAEIRINLAHIQHNIAALQHHAGPAIVMPIIKADAYGHGLEQVYRAALAAGARQFGVALVEEGEALRQLGCDQPILVLGYVPPTAADRVIEARLCPMTMTLAQVDAFSTAASQRRATVDLHIKVDTGMGRYGVAPVDAPGFVAAASVRPSVNVEGIYTHFARADDPDPAPTLTQLKQFQSVLNALDQANLRPTVRHAANSAATLRFPATHLDLVRPGLAIYGLPPGPGAPPIELRPALSIHARLGPIHTVAAGATISYGGRWTAPSRAKIGVVPVGYGDGIPRLLYNRGHVIVRGQPAPIVGVVCMDALMIDVTRLPNVSTGDWVTILGDNAAGSVTADDLAEWSETISYEIVTRLGPRLSRRAIGG